jgi:competence protein ComGC
MKIFNGIISIIAISVLLIGCLPEAFKENANQKFGDQHFKTAIQLIELHKLREGEYPASLDSLKYLGDWDKIIFGSVKYTKLESGYELDLINGWMGKPNELEYPKDFWKGLGIIKSNMKK